MNQERMLGIMNNLLFVMQEGGLLDRKGVWKINEVIIDNLINVKE